ncbi:MAG: hypothetical protein QXV22_01765, partial [Thermoplasmataceae archaeon]
VLLIFFLNFPFIMVTAIGNFVKPIFIVTVLHGGAIDISLSEFTYAALASLMGLLLSHFLKGRELFMSYLFYIIYTAGSFLIPYSSSFLMYLAFQAAHGIGNPGIRICRNTFVMKNINRNFSGRFFGAVSFVSNIARVSLLLFAMATVNIIGPGKLFTASGFILAAALAGSTILIMTGRTGDFVIRKIGDKSEPQAHHLS